MSFAINLRDLDLYSKTLPTPVKIASLSSGAEIYVQNT